MSGFGHSQATLDFWRDLVGRALPMAPTPFYLLSAVPLNEGLTELEEFSRRMPLPVRHWLSCKTQPVPALLQWWKRSGRGIEVVSEFEFRAALCEGYVPEQILLNGPAKQYWLPGVARPKLRVNFDSIAELESLLRLAKQMDWSVGVRCSVLGQTRPGAAYPSQFGMTPDEAVWAIRKLVRACTRVETIHFHCGTQMTSSQVYARAVEQVESVCRAANFGPRFLDCGGGFPASHVLSLKDEPYDAQFDFGQLAERLTKASLEFPSIQELWMENGRFLSARAGVLVVRVVDIKDRGPIRHLICDGGRTMNGVISQWETHNLFAIPRRGGRLQLSAICGPTCMAFDQLAFRPLSSRIRAGDCLVWMDAGAYHIPWETRFSHGHSAVLWHEDNRLELVRKAQPFEEWWGK